MRIALVLPPVLLDEAPVQRILDSVSLYFGPEAVIEVHAPEESLSHYAAFMKKAPAAYDRQALLDRSEVVVLVDGIRGSMRADDPANLADRRVYSVQDGARLRLENSPLDEREYPFLETHVFNRLSPRSVDGYFYYFPYGYLFRYTGWGPIDPFGFRVAGDPSALANRPPEHKLVVVFGGSAAWSMYSTHEEMFPSRLEALLNTYCREAGRSERFTVLNFGMHGHTVLNQMIAYTLFVEPLNPDFVLSHDGFNDLGYGQLSDTFLLRKGISYQTNLEEWSPLLHQTDGQNKTHASSPYRPVNLPPNVVKAYVDRKGQFMRQVERSGAVFIWGLQPFVGSKSALAPAEASKLQDELAPVPDRPFCFMYRNQAHMFSLAQRAVARVSDPLRVVDLHKAFGSFGVDEHLFADFVHTTPTGDERIAREYMNYFANVWLGSHAGGWL